jgi:hypothetical protein
MLNYPSREPTGGEGGVAEGGTSRWKAARPAAAWLAGIAAVGGASLALLPAARAVVGAIAGACALLVGTALVRRLAGWTATLDAAGTALAVAGPRGRTIVPLAGVGPADWEFRPVQVDRRVTAGAALAVLRTGPYLKTGGRRLNLYGRISREDYLRLSAEFGAPWAGLYAGNWACGLVLGANRVVLPDGSELAVDCAADRLSFPAAAVRAGRRETREIRLGYWGGSFRAGRNTVYYEAARPFEI